MSIESEPTGPILTEIPQRPKPGEANYRKNGETSADGLRFWSLSRSAGKKKTLHEVWLTPEKYEEYKAKRRQRDRIRKANPDSKIRERHYQDQRRYGIGPGDRQSLYEYQKGMCYLECGRKLPADVWKANLEHCHSTGNVRGLSCTTCNVGLGAFGDSPFKMMRAANILMSVDLTPGAILGIGQNGKGQKCAND